MMTGGPGEAGTKLADVETVMGSDPLRLDAAGFEALYRANSSYVYNACLGMLGNADDARDAMQETFVQLYRSLPKIRRRENLRTWLYRVAINKCNDMLRGKRIECVEVSVDALSGAGGDDGLKEEQVRQAILTLKPKYRAVLVLFYFEEQSYAEIAEALRCSQGQVRIWLHRARRAFKNVYEKEERDEVQ